MTTTMIVEDKRSTNKTGRFTPTSGIGAVKGIVLL